MDPHLILDTVTLCVVACLVLLIIASKALKRGKLPCPSNRRDLRLTTLF